MRLGIDLGGSKIEGVVLDSDNHVVARRRVPTPVGEYDGTITAICDLVDALAAAAPVGWEVPVGIAMPGSFSRRTGLVKNANSTCLNGRPFDTDLASALGRRVRAANDANCLALSEASDGAAKGHAVVFGVILGTGVGGGVVVDGRILAGPNGIGGEWGHIQMPWMESDEQPSRACYCGKTDCVETWLSGPGLAESYADQRGLKLTGQEIVAAARAGEACAQSALERHGQRIGRSLAAVVNILDPDLIVLGGGVSNIDEIYEAIPAALSRHAFSDGVTTPVVRALHGDSSGVRGAAWLWDEA